MQKDTHDIQTESTVLITPFLHGKTETGCNMRSTLCSQLPLRTANNEQRTIHHLFFFTALWHAVLYIGRVVGKVQTSATGAVLWEGKLEHGMNLLLWWGESVLHWCKYNLYLVLVPDPKPTPAWIAFSTVEAIYAPDEVWGRDYLYQKLSWDCLYCLWVHGWVIEWLSVTMVRQQMSDFLCTMAAIETSNFTACSS